MRKSFHSTECKDKTRRKKRWRLDVLIFSRFLWLWWNVLHDRMVNCSFLNIMKNVHVSFSIQLSLILYCGLLSIKWHFFDY